MNGFEKHGLKHTSPSQLNMWAECAGAWAARYLFNKKFSFGVAPLIGIIVEDVVADTLCGMSYEDALAKGEKRFNKENALNTNEKDLARRGDIKAMSEIALEELKQYGEPEFIHNLTGRKQQSIELKCKGDGWELPIIGYLDFVFPKHGLVIDLKTTLRCPSAISPAHARQAAVYSKARGNNRVKFLYVTPKKFNLLEVEDEAAVLDEIKAILNRQERFLRMDAEQIKDCVPVNAGSFYWSGNDYLIRKELYGY